MTEAQQHVGAPAGLQLLLCPEQPQANDHLIELVGVLLGMKKGLMIKVVVVFVEGCFD